MNASTCIVCSVWYFISYNDYLQLHKLRCVYKSVSVSVILRTFTTDALYRVRLNSVAIQRGLLSDAPEQVHDIVGRRGWCSLGCRE